MTPIHFLLSKPSNRIKQCGSRFWGNPDLPKWHKYPTYNDIYGNPFEYQFICQINLTELAPYDIERVFPDKGLLSFFAKIDHYLGHMDGGSCISGYISDTEDVKVLFFPEVGAPGCNPDFDEMILLDENNIQMNPKELQIKFTINHSDTYLEDHALLADPTYREWETWDPPYEDWQILLQIDSFNGVDFSLNFMDSGVLNFLISPDDLKNANYGRVRAIVLSS